MDFANPDCVEGAEYLGAEGYPIRVDEQRCQPRTGLAMDYSGNLILTDKPAQPL